MFVSYIGDDVYSKKGFQNIKRPNTRGIVNGCMWESMEMIWDHIFYHGLEVDPSNHPILLTEAPLNPNTNREYF